MKKLPKVGVYLTAKEFVRLVNRYEILINSAVTVSGGKLKEIRVEGKIGYHDLEKLKSLLKYK